MSLTLPTAASAAITATVTNGQLVVKNDAGGVLAIGCSGNGGNVKINGGDPGTGPALCSAITGIEVKDLVRNPDTFDLGAVTAAQFNALTSVVLEGGENADTLIGSGIADTIKGGGSSDRLIGGAGADSVHGEEGNDTLVWSPGDGNDVLDGDTGSDTAEVDGDGTPEQFTVKSAATAGRLDLERGGTPQLDIGGAEILDLNTGGGNDGVAVNSGPTDPTDLSAVSVDADGGPGEDTLGGGPGKDRLAGGPDHDLISGGGGDDTLVRKPGDGSDQLDGGVGTDTVEVNGDQTGEQFTVQAAGARVAVAGTDTPSAFSLDVGSSEKLDLNAAGGDDVLNPGGATAGLAGFVIDANGGPGADVLNGSDASDVLKGGADEDRLSGGLGFDLLLGEEGDDTLVWNLGDGNDTMGGNAGTDTVEVNGGGAGEQFTVQPAGSRVSVAGTAPTPFSLDAFEAEGLDLNAGGGDDELNAAGPVPGLGGFAIHADGGPGEDLLNGAGAGDTLDGGEGDDTLSGGAGADHIASRDTAPDTVSCGTEVDSVTADATDSVDADCETVDRGTVDPTSTAVQCAPAEVLANEAITCTVKVKDTAQQNPSTPTEKVALRSDHAGGAPAPCMLAPVNGKADEAQCELTFTPTEVARHKLIASYEGDGAHNSSASSTQVTANLRPSVTSLACAPASIALGSGSITCTAMVSDPGAKPLGPSGTVKFSAATGGFINGGSCPLAGAAGSKASCQIIYTPNASGADRITAAYQGDLAYGPSEGSASVSAQVLDPGPRFPNTTLKRKPARKTSSRRASFTFFSDLAGSPFPGARFRCKLDKKPFNPCRSPFKAKGLKPGHHSFRVRAVTSAGEADPTPATYRWRITR